jgi:hypothetical protein
LSGSRVSFSTYQTTTTVMTIGIAEKMPVRKVLRR